MPRKVLIKWDRLNAQIQSFIFFNCTPSIIEHIKHMTGARLIWLHLDGSYNWMTPMKRVASKFRGLDEDSCADKIGFHEGSHQQTLGFAAGGSSGGEADFI